MMTPKEKLKVHVQIEQDNARKLREWEERKDSYSWQEQVGIRLMNLGIAEEEIDYMIELGVIA